jgi:anti-sigma factor RsiW
MSEPEYLPLIHAEIDGELDGPQRGELARRLLADPDVRAVREDLRRVCTALDAMPQVEPPPELHESILAALPKPAAVLPRPAARQLQAWSFDRRWRYAALIAGVIAGGTALFVKVEGSRPSTTDTVGTMAAAQAVTVDTVTLANGPVAGRVSLSRGASGLALRFELVTSGPVDVLVASDGHALRFNGLGGPGAAGETGTTVALPGFAAAGQPVDLTFLMSGHEVGHATLTAPEGH